MTTSLADDVIYAYESLQEVTGHTQVTYKRFKESTYDPDSGETKTWYETPSFTPIMGDVDSYTASNNADLKTNDKTLVFKQSEFTQQSGESDEPEPKPGDEIDIDGKTWTPDLDGNTLWREDTMQKLFKVFIRRKA